MASFEQHASRSDHHHQHQHQQQQQNQQQGQGRHTCSSSCCSRSVATAIQCSNSTWMVHHLNNRGSVLVINGNYSAANHLFELALKKHKQITELKSSSASSSSSCSMSPSSQSSCCCCCCCCHSSNIAEDDCHHGIENNNAYNDSQSPSTFVCDDYDDDSDDDDDDDDDSNYSDDKMSIDPPTLTTRTGGGSSSNTNDRNKRMTTTSQLRTFSFCGQQEQHDHDDHRQHRHQLYNHQVYSLPIVMNEQEWETASIEDKSFVLIFNTALCNHLWGMDLLLLAQQQDPQQDPQQLLLDNKNNPLCHRAFLIARMMYRLGLESVVSFVHGVDKLCYVAMFNNISHVCKTLEGYNSHEAYCFDKMLLKSVFWLKDSSSSETTTTTTTATAAATITTTTVSSSGRRISVNNSNDVTTNNRYDDDDLEIIDAFLGNIFYLIGVPQEIVPAAAA